LGTFADSKPDRWGRELAAFLNLGKVSPDTSLPAPSCQKAWLRSIGAIATDFERIRAGLEPLYNVGIFHRARSQSLGIRVGGVLYRDTHLRQRPLFVLTARCGTYHLSMEALA
jgi:hypothetical protein